MNNTEAIRIVIQVAGNASQEISGVTAAIGLLSGAFLATQNVIRQLGSVASTVFGLLIGQNESLRQQILATQASLVATGEVFRNGIRVDNAAQAIQALQGPIAASLDDLRRKTLDLVGVTTSELIPVFRIVSTNLGSLGLPLSAAVDLTTSFAAGLGTLGIPLNQANQEIRSILQGQIDSNSVLARSLNLQSEDVRLWRQQGVLVERLNERLSAFVEGNRLAADSVTGISSNIQDLFEIITQQVGQPLLRPLTDGLREIFTFLRENERAIVQTLRGAVEGLIGLTGQVSSIIGPAIGQVVDALTSIGSVTFDASLAAFQALTQTFIVLLQVAAPFVEILGTIAQLLASAFDNPVGRAVITLALLTKTIATLGPLLLAFATRSVLVAANSLLFLAAQAEIAGIALLRNIIPSIIATSQAFLTNLVPAIVATITQLGVLAATSNTGAIRAIGAVLLQIGGGLASITGVASGAAGGLGAVGASGAAAAAGIASAVAAAATAAATFGLVLAALVSVTEAWGSYNRITSATEGPNRIRERAEALEEELQSLRRLNRERQNQAPDDSGPSREERELERIRRQQGTIANVFDAVRGGLGLTTSAQAELSSATASTDDAISSISGNVSGLVSQLNALQKQGSVDEDVLNRFREAIKSAQDQVGGLTGSTDAQDSSLRDLAKRLDEVSAGASNLGNDVTIVGRELEDFGTISKALQDQVASSIETLGNTRATRAVFDGATKSLIDLTQTQVEQGNISREAAIAQLSAVTSNTRTQVSERIRALKLIDTFRQQSDSQAKKAAEDQKKAAEAAAAALREQVQEAERTAQAQLSIARAAASSRELAAEQARSELGTVGVLEEVAASNRQFIDDQLLIQADFRARLAALPDPTDPESIRAREKLVRDSLAESNNLQLELQRAFIDDVRTIENARLDELQVASDRAQSIFEAENAKRRELLERVGAQDAKLQERLTDEALELEQSRIQDLLRLERDRRDALDKLPPVDDPIINERRQQEIRQSIIRTSELRIELTQNEAQIQETLFQQQLENFNQLADGRSNLVKAATEVADILQTIAEKDLDDRIKAAKSESDRNRLINQRFALEQQQADREIAASRLQTEIDIQRNRILSEREVIRARAAREQARLTQLEAQALKIDLQRAGASQADLASVSELIQQSQRVISQAEQRVAETERQLAVEEQIANLTRQAGNLQAVRRQIEVQQSNPNTRERDLNIRTLQQQLGLGQDGNINDQLKNLTDIVQTNLKGVLSNTAPSARQPLGGTVPANSTGPSLAPIPQIVTIPAPDRAIPRPPEVASPILRATPPPTINFEVPEPTVIQSTPRAFSQLELSSEVARQLRAQSGAGLPARASAVEVRLPEPQLQQIRQSQLAPQQNQLQADLARQLAAAADAVSSAAAANRNVNVTINQQISGNTPDDQLVSIREQALEAFQLVLNA